MEHLKADYTEVWISSPVVPLVRFADRVCALSQTGIDLVGIGDIPVLPHLAERLRSFDCIVSWYGANRSEFRSALQRIGLECKFHSALPPLDYAGHAADFFAAQVGAAAALIPRIEVEKSAPRETIIIHPFSGSARKNWPLERYREVARRLPVRVEWCAGPEEELAEATRFENLGHLASWLTGARLYIGNDSGITHLAAAAGVPVIALFGPSAPGLWAPRGDVTVMQWGPSGDLAVNEILGAARRVLEPTLHPASSER